MVHTIPITNIGLEGVVHVAPENNGEQDDERKGNVTYGIDDVPPWYLCIFMALQHYLTMIGAIVAIPFILCPALCMTETDPNRSNIISTMIFVTGLITWLQATFGCRLPIVQGGTISFLVPTLAILNLPAWQCPATDVLEALPAAEQQEVWMSRMRELSGAIAVSALFQMFLGYFGVIGSLLRFVTPLTIAPTVALVGLTLFDHAADAASQHWGIAAGFYHKFKIPALGCIDGTHVAIVCPAEHEERYFNRKGYHSLNVMIICESNLNILCVDASYPGSTHDSVVWANHPINSYIERLHTIHGEDLFLLGDSGYPLRSTMMIPISDPQPDTPEEYYQDLHLPARSIVERCIGVLKARFRTFTLLTIFSQCMTNVTIPVLSWKKDKGCTIIWFPLFKLFPVLLTIVLMWALCAILTATGVFPPNHPARTDVKINIIEDAPWFRVPYPGQWGAPTVSVAGVLGMLAGVLACTVESISYYPTTARMCAAPPPPLHAINRGLGTEGLGTVLAGLWGSGNGTNTFGENVGAIGVTKVGSRRVVQWAAGLMVLQGVVGKLGAVFIIIPQPIVGGLFCVMFGMISAFGLSALQYVDLNSSRNLYIIGFSLFFPLVLTRWMAVHSGVIQTGAEALDAVLQVLLSTSILVGGIIGCLLDNLIPGTDEERGLAAWAKEMSLDAAGASEHGDTYDFPIGMGLIRRWKWTQYLPFMPTYQAGKFSELFKKKDI